MNWLGKEGGWRKKREIFCWCFKQVRASAPGAGTFPSLTCSKQLACYCSWLAPVEMLSDLLKTAANWCLLPSHCSKCCLPLHGNISQQTREHPSQNAFIGTLSKVPSSQLPENGSGSLSGRKPCLRNHKEIYEAGFCATCWTQLGSLEDSDNG